MLKRYIVIVLTGFMLFGCSSKNQGSENKINTGNLEQTSNNTSKDKNITKNGPEEKGEYGKMLKGLGEMKYNELLPELEKKYKEDSKNLDYVMMYANTILYKNNFEYKKEDLNKVKNMINLALKDYPKNSELWRLLGYTYEIEGDYKKAEEYYKKAVDNNNKNALAYANLGHLYYILGDNNLAETYLKLSLKLDDENDYVLLNLADVYNAKGTTQKAEEYYKKVLKSSYNNYMKAQASYNLGNIYYDKNNLEKAEEYYKKSVNYYDKFDLGYIGMSKVLFSKYVLSVKNGKEDKELYEKSKEYLEKALKLNPNRVYAYYLMGLQYQALGDNSKAVKYYKLGLRKVYKDDIPNSLKIEYKNTLTNLINSLK